MDRVLFYAAKEDGIVRELRRTLQSGGDETPLDIARFKFYGSTALHGACDALHLETIRLLLDGGVDLESKDFRGNTPLMSAVLAYTGREVDEDKKEIVVKLLLDSGANVDAQADEGTTAIQYACMDEQWEIARLLLESGANVNVAANNGTTALHWACRDHLGIARLLLIRDAVLEAKGTNDQTPLHWACNRSGNIDAVQELVQRKADIFAKDAYNKTPFDKANALGGNEAVTEFLLEQYEEKVCQQEGRLPLHAILGEAVYLENGKVQLPIGTLTVDELLTLLGSIHSRDPDSVRRKDRNRSLPLHVACRTNAPIKVLRFFVDHDANALSTMGSAGSLPIHEACRGGASLTKIKFLVEKGDADDTLCARDFNAALPLHVLCQSNPTVDVVKYMVQSYPISISEKTSSGALPFMLACEGSASVSVLHFLLTKCPEALAAK